MHSRADPTNPVLQETLETLENSDAPVYRDVAEDLGTVNRKRPEVNLSDLERVAEDGETVVVPGKVLGSGYLTKELTVAAFKASTSARQAIEDGGEFMFIEELVDENPEGEGVRIVK